MPSFGYTIRHRLASSEYSTRCTGDCSSRTVNGTVPAAGAVRLPARSAAVCCRCRSVLLSSSPRSAVAGEFDGRVRRGDLQHVGAVRNRGRVPHEDRDPTGRASAPSTTFPLHGDRTRRTGADRRSGPPPSRRRSAAPSDRPAGRAAAPAGDSAGPAPPIDSAGGRRRCCPRTRRSPSRRSRTAAGRPRPGG